MPPAASKALQPTSFDLYYETDGFYNFLLTLAGDGYNFTGEDPPYGSESRAAHLACLLAPHPSIAQASPASLKNTLCQCRPPSTHLSPPVCPCFAALNWYTLNDAVLQLDLPDLPGQLNETNKL